MYSAIGNASQSGSGIVSTSRCRSDNPLVTTRSPVRNAMPFTSDSGRRSPVGAQQLDEGLLALAQHHDVERAGGQHVLGHGGAVLATQHEQACGNFSRIVRATRCVSGHSVLNMHVTAITRLSGWIRPTISSGVSPCTMKSDRSG